MKHASLVFRVGDNRFPGYTDEGLPHKKITQNELSYLLTLLKDFLWMEHNLITK